MRAVLAGRAASSVLFGSLLAACSGGSSNQSGTAAAAGAVGAAGAAGTNATGGAVATGGNGLGGTSTGGSSGSGSGGISNAGGGSTTGGTGGGSSAGGGTSTSTGGAQQVGACDSLGAPGSWQTITPAQAQTTQAVVLDPFRSGTIWLATTGSGLFRSSDCGSTWAHVNTGQNGSEVDRAAIWSLAIDYARAGVIYVIGQYGPQGVFKSTDGGVDWQQLMPPGGEIANTIPAGPSNPTLAAIGSISMDPTDHLHLAVGAHANCTGAYAPACGAETTDGGATWKLFKTPFLNGWAEQTGPYVINRTTILYATLFNGLWLTTDNGANWKDVTPAGVAGATGGEYTDRPFAPLSDGNYYVPSYNTGGLLRSTNQGASWTRLPNAPNGSYELGFAPGLDRVFLGDANGHSVSFAPLSNPSSWTRLADLTAPLKPAYLQYDDAHHVLYSAGSGVARMVVQ